MPIVSLEIHQTEKTRPDDSVLVQYSPAGTSRIRSYVRDAHQIDKLLRRGIIDNLQHIYGLQLLVLHTQANRSTIGSAAYDTSPRIGNSSMEASTLDLILARDRLNHTMCNMRVKHWKMVSLVCFDELPAIKAAQQCKVGVKQATEYTRTVFDALGDALVKMREFYEMNEQERKNHLKSRQ